MAHRDAQHRPSERYTPAGLTPLNASRAAPDAGAVRSSFPMAAVAGDPAGAVVAAVSAAAFLEAAYARIIADEGIAQKVRNAEWQAAIDALISHMRTGEIAAGFIAAIARCGAVLAAHAPPDGSANELPDRLYVM